MNKKKTVWIIISVVLVVIISALTIYVFANPSAPDPTLQSKTAIAKYLASDEFAKLPKDKQLKYFSGVDSELDGEQLPREGLSDAEKKKLRENVGPLMRERFNSKIKEYFKLSPDEKKAFLDKMAEDMKKRRENAPQRNTGGGQAPSPNNARQAPGGGNSADRARSRIENTPPEERAMHAQFRKDMQAHQAAARAAAQQK